MAALAALVSLAGCGLLPGETREAISIPPASAGSSSDSGFGPGVQALSFGPVDKGSPRMSPSGKMVSFVAYGRVAEKPLPSQSASLSTGGDLYVEHAEWLPDGTLVALGVKEKGQSAETVASSSLFAARRGEDVSTDDQELIKRVEAVGAVPDGGLVVASEAPPAQGSSEEQITSRLVLLKGSEEPMKFYLKGIEGRVTGLSISPDGGLAMLAVLRNDTGRGDGKRFEVQIYRFSDSQVSLAARLPAGTELLGAPQWTSQGAYFVAGDAGVDNEPGPYTLYRTVSGSEEPEPVSAVGEGFVAASVSVSPKGDRLAVIGRRNLSSPTNLYVLNIDSGTLDTATTNEDMEIKASPRDLSWSPDSQSVILVAREALTGPTIYDTPAEELSSAFYNLYQVPVGEPESAE
ncbi:MAG: hypothetical protein AVDCRST_MAG37-16 [uncultured Rubrobacteraceae bacterium]|uniref:Lipoprotein LpqB beta-propeller domain-containing protein n=1 Tax=uncultured Rubrobacteraceae bacterium TaxID=349277 RepID=A0A6J4PRH0_9ACTN|nr:MAG: hypothetical protein AVDCRST_MAG37-16 [uncultured Rubrobacteraceae bacterium]